MVKRRRLVNGRSIKITTKSDVERDMRRGDVCAIAVVKRLDGLCC